MAGNTVNVGLQVTTQGLDKAVNQSKEFRDNMHGGAGALASAEKASRGASNAAYRKENQEYGVNRAIGSGTGAASRDFAQQAQGLGGLVHLYATFAANIFAVTAAFTQLSKAADTKNMLEGMSQLSASSGRTLKTLAGEMKDLSDGALSMRDSLNATALASAGGMTNQQILKMTDLARKASAALGRDMSDSMDRLTKGIVKVQPELLDELGIMTRVIPAQQAYALSLGKSVDSLTDFEKKQAFANAVLKEAENKFGAINVDANPYSKLSASLADLATNGLMVLNNVISPIAKFLAESPTALAGAVALLTGVLVKQAFPVLSNMKQLARDVVAREATKANSISAETFAPAAAAHKKLLDTLNKNTSDFINESDVMDKKLTKIYGDKLPKIWKDVQGKIPEEVTQSQIDALYKKGAELQARNAKAGKNNSDKTNLYTEYADRISAAKIGLAEIDDLRKKSDDIYLERQSKLTAAGNAQAIADRMNQAVRRDSIKLSSVEFASLNGVIAGWKKMNEQIAEARKGGQVKTIETKNAAGEVVSSMKVGIPAMSAWGAGATRVATGAGLALQGVLNLSSAIGVAGMVAGAAVAVFEVMDAIFSTNAKSLAAFNTSLASFTEASKVADDTITSIYKKPLDQVFSIPSIIAASTALSGFSGSLTKVLEDFSKLQEQSSWFDKAVEWVKGLAGYSASDKLNKQFNSGIVTSLKAISDPKLKQAAEQNIRSIMQMQDSATITEKTLKEAESHLKEEDVLSKQKAIAEVLKQTADLSSKSNIQQYAGAMDTFVKSYDTFLTSLKSSDPMQVLARDMFTVANSVQTLGNNLQDVSSALLTITDIVDNPDKLRLFPKDTQDELLQNKKALDDMKNSVSQIQKDLGYAQERNDKARKFFEESKTFIPGGIDSAQGRDSLKDLSLGNTRLNIAAKDFIESYDQINTLRKQEGNLLNTQSNAVQTLYGVLQRVSKAAIDFATQITEVDRAMANAKAQVTIIKGIAQGLSSSRSAQLDAYTTQISNSAERQQIELQKQLIEQSSYALDATKEQIIALNANTAAINLASNPNSKFAQEAAIAADTAKKVAEYSKKFANAKSEEDKTRVGVEAMTTGGLNQDQVNTALNNAKTLEFNRRTQLSKLDAQTTQLNASDYVAATNANAAKLTEQADTITKKLEQDLKFASNTINSLKDAAGSGSDTVISLLEASNTLAKTTRDSEVSARSDAQEKIFEADQLRINAITDDRVRGLQQAELSEKMSAYNAGVKLKLLESQRQSVEESYKVQKALLDTEINRREIAKQLLDISNEVAQSSMDYEKKYIELRKTSGSISDALAIKETAELERKSEKLSAEQKLADLELANFKALEAKKLEAERNKGILAANYDPNNMTEADKLKLKEGQDAIDAKLLETNAQLTDVYNAQVAAVTQKLNLMLAYSAANEKVLAQQAAQKQQLDFAVSGATSLAAVFGEIGTSISSAVEELTKLGATIQNNATNQTQAQASLAAATANRLAIEEQLKAAETSPVREALIDSRAKALEKESEEKDNLRQITVQGTMAEIQGAANISKAMGSMFAKNTAAAKAFAAVEKAFHVVRLAMWAKEMIMSLQKTAQNITNATLEGQAFTAVGAIRAFADSPWFVAAGVSAMILALGASLFGGSGGSSINMTGMTSADRQSVQGTGLSYDANGNKVENGGGVFGDTEAKSETIKNSLELIANTSVKGMSYSNKMVDLLTSIDKGIESMAISLYSVQGIRTGSGFGTIEGSFSEKGMSKGNLITDPLGIFSTTTTTDTSIIDSGIKLSGTFKDLANAGSSATAVLSQFETLSVTSTTKGMLFGLIGGGTDTAIKDNIKDLDQNVREQIGGIFSNAAALFEHQGQQLGLGIGFVESALSTINVDKLASLRGLKGADLQKELNSVIGSIMDDTAKTLFPKLDVFKKFGEGYSQTVTRVIDTNEKIGLAFKQLGKPLIRLPEIASKATTEMVDRVRLAQDNLKTLKEQLAASKTIKYTMGDSEWGSSSTSETVFDPELIKAVAISEKELKDARKAMEDANAGATVNNIALTEALANAAGGTDKFLELTSKFTDGYLSDVERAGPRLTAFNEYVTKLGLSAGITKDGIKELITNYKFVVDSTGKVTKESSDYYVELLKLSDAYTTASEDIDKIANKLGMSTSGISGILSDAVKNAKSEEEARKLGTQGFADALNQALQNSLISGISNIIYSSVITPLISSLATGGAAAGLDIATGGAVGAANLSAGSAVGATNLATGGAVGAANLAAGGAAGATNLVAGSQIAGATLAAAVSKVKDFVGTFIEVMKDPEVKSALKGLASSFGDFTAAAYSGSSAINTLTTSIGGTTKSAAGSGSGGGGASDAADSLASAWQQAADSIFAEVKRIRGLMVVSSEAALTAAQAKFDQATILARAGDIDAAKSLPELSQALLSTAEATTTSLKQLRQIQAATQDSLERTGLGAVSQYKLKLPSYDVGTNIVPTDMIAQIHAGEQIVPKAFNPALNNDSSNDEIKALRKQMAELLEVTNAQAADIYKLRQVLVNVTQDGRAMQSETV